MDAFDRAINIRTFLDEQGYGFDAGYFPLSYTFWRLTYLVQRDDLGAMGPGSSLRFECDEFFWIADMLCAGEELTASAVSC
jgi:hypothetical protein